MQRLVIVVVPDFAEVMANLYHKNVKVLHVGFNVVCLSSPGRGLCHIYVCLYVCTYACMYVSICACRCSVLDLLDYPIHHTICVCVCPHPLDSLYR